MDPHTTIEDCIRCRMTPGCWQWTRNWSSLLLARWALATIFMACVSCPTNAQSTAAVQPLQLGSVLPDVSGETITGSPIHLFGVVNGKIAVVIFSFSKGGGEDARAWNEHLNREYSGNSSVACSTVIELQAAPRLLRGIIKSALGRDMPPYIRERTIITYKDEALWKRRLAVTDSGHAYVLVLGEDGRVRWRSSKAFNDIEFGDIERNVLEQLRSVRLR